MIGSRSLFCASLVLFGATSSGQDVLFSTRHDGGFDEAIYGVRTTVDNSFIVFGSCSSESGSPAKVCISLIDQEGAYFLTNTYGDGTRDHRLGKDPVSKSTDGHFALGVTVGPMASLWWLNSIGDTLWSREPFPMMGETSQATGTAIARNGEVLLCGTILHQGSSIKLFLARYSTGGELQWLHEYDGDATWQGHAGQMDTLSNGGFVLCGRRIDPFGYDSDTWLVATDSSGALAWEQYIDTPGEDGARPVLSLPYNEFIVGGFIKAENPGQPGDFCCPSPYFARYSNAGNLLWDSTYAGSGNEIYSFDMCLLPDGSILSSGAASSQFGTRVYLFAIDMDGDSLWHRQYFAPDSSCVNYSYWPFSVISESPSSIVLAGFVGLCNNDQWIMRVDENGTPPPTMQLWNSISANNLTLQPLSISPNPTRGRLEIRTEALIDDVQILDMFGRSVRHLRVQRSVNSFDLDLSDLPSGMYILAASNRSGDFWREALVLD